MSIVERIKEIPNMAKNVIMARITTEMLRAEANARGLLEGHVSAKTTSELISLAAGREDGKAVMLGMLDSRILVEELSRRRHDFSQELTPKECLDRAWRMDEKAVLNRAAPVFIARLHTALANAGANMLSNFGTSLNLFKLSVKDSVHKVE